jgi:hypothetical protein
MRVSLSETRLARVTSGAGLMKVYFAVGRRTASPDIGFCGRKSSETRGWVEIAGEHYTVARHPGQTVIAVAPKVGVGVV